MTPPEATQAGQLGQAGDAEPAVSFCPIAMLRQRADFLRASRAGKVAAGSFLLQARQRQPDETATGVRLGITCSRKVGNAVIRNRAKRRLREVARLVLPYHGRDGWDYVLVGRPGVTVSAPFDAMTSALSSALAEAHRPKAPR